MVVAANQVLYFADLFGKALIVRFIFVSRSPPFPPESKLLILFSAEEVEDASLVVPRCMWWSYVLNAAMGIVILITMLFCIGDLNTAIGSTAPYLVLFKNTGSVGVALMLSVLIFLLIFSGNVTALATTSREMWAFSRDHGFPCSRWISKVSFPSPLISNNC